MKMYKHLAVRLTAILMVTAAFIAVSWTNPNVEIAAQAVHINPFDYAIPDIEEPVD